MAPRAFLALRERFVMDHPKPSSPLVPVIIGFGVFAVGLAAAMATLPEWAGATFPPPAAVEARLPALLETLHVQPESARSVSYLAAADDISPGLGGGLEARVALPAGWHGVTGGRFEVAFGPRGDLRSLGWMPLRFMSFYAFTGKKPDARTRPEVLLPLFLAPGERVGEPRLLQVEGAPYETYPLLSVDTPEHIGLFVTPNLVVMAWRAPGTLEAAEGAMERKSAGRLWSHMAVKGGVFLAVLGLFLVLLARNRLDFKDGLVVATLALAGSLGGAVSLIEGGVAWWQVGIVAMSATLFLFLLWSAAESWLRTTEPAFTTSLDFLRAGRLGPRGGRALLAGWGWGAALAGLWLLLHVAAVGVPGLVRHQASVVLPHFQRAGNPFYDGSLIAGLVMLGVTLGHRLVPAPGKTTAGIVAGALLLVPKLEFEPLPFRLVVCLVIVAFLVFVFRRFGLVALLVAAITSFLLPAAVLAALHWTWLSGTFFAAALPLVAFPVFGLIGLRRPPEMEGEALLPAFVRRVEEERRLKYEMDLLARMQIDLLPGSPPRVPGYDLAATSFVATEAGGDFYDFFYDEADRFWLAAGDVAGHGYACTIELAMLKAALHSLVAAGQTPATVLAKLDGVLRESRSVRTFTCLTLLVLEPATGRGLIANAGFPFPFFARDSEVEEMALPGLPLGQGPPRTYRDQPFHLAAGEVLFLASDGLGESLDAAVRPYGFARASTLLPAMVREGAAQILEGVIADWRRHRGSEPAADDTSLVVLKRELDRADAS